MIFHMFTKSSNKVGQSSTNQKNFEERKNSLGQVIYQKCVTVVVSEKTVTHARTHMVQIIISRRRARREIMRKYHLFFCQVCLHVG